MGVIKLTQDVVVSRKLEMFRDACLTEALYGKAVAAVPTVAKARTCLESKTPTPCPVI
jgi:hypothetical protein